MAVNLTPLHDRVIVKRIEEKETTRGGIIIPDTAKEKPMEGEIIAVGAGKREKGERIPLDVKPGDRVAAFMPNMCETIIAMLATSSIGAIWSSASPDFGVQGDRVLFGKYSGTEIKIEDEELLILKEDEILAKISGAAKAAGSKK